MGQASRGALKLMFITGSVLPAKSWVFYIAMPANSSHGLLNCCKITLCLFQNCLSHLRTGCQSVLISFSETLSPLVLKLFLLILSISSFRCCNRETCPLLLFTPDNAFSSEIRIDKVCLRAATLFYIHCITIDPKLGIVNQLFIVAVTTSCP